MFFKKFAFLVSVSCALSTTLLIAQEATPERGGRSQPGRSSGRDTTPLAAGRPAPTSTIVLTFLAKVQEELQLTVEQKQKLETLRKSTADKQREIYAEMQKRASELNQQEEADARKLLDEKQVGRLEQLRLQREGVITLARPEIMEKLGLTAEQREKLAKLAQEYRGVLSFAGGFGRSGTVASLGEPAPSGTATERSSRGGTAQANTDRERIAADMVFVLTPEQKKKWDELQGTKFEFSNPSFGGPGGGTSRTSFLITGRTRPFELGQTTSSGTRFARTAATVLGPLGPFRYQSVIEILALTDEQKSQIKAIAVEDAKDIGQIATVPEAEQSAKIAGINKTTQEKLDKVLNDEQKAKLKELLTAPPSNRQ